MRRILVSAIVLITTSIPGGAWGQPAVSSEIAPLGKLRVAMNGGNPVLVWRHLMGADAKKLEVNEGALSFSVDFDAQKVEINLPLSE